MCKLPIPCKIQICCIVAAIFTALTGALSSQHAAYAQGSNNDYVDVGLTLEVPESRSSIDLNLIVVNNGTRAAYDVEVVVTFVSPPPNPPLRKAISLCRLPTGKCRLGACLRRTTEEPSAGPFLS